MLAGRAPGPGSCLGIRCNIWARAQLRREITRLLRGGGNDKIGGGGAFRWQEMVCTDEVRFGKYSELCYLPKKFANLLYDVAIESLLDSFALPELKLNLS